MSTTCHRSTILLLAVSLLAVGTAPLVAADHPSPDDHNENDCRIPSTFEGYLWAANPYGDRFLASQFSYQTVEDGHLGEYVNGIDAYIVDLGCRLSPGQTPRYCIQRVESTDDGPATVKLLFTERDDDLAVSHFGSGWDLLATHNPEGISDFCERIPGTARYAVVWTKSGAPRGVQTSSASDYLSIDTSENRAATPPGPFTLKFCLEVGTSLGECPDPLR